MFCCGTDNNDKNEIVIYNLADNTLKSVLNRQNNVEQLFKDVQNYITIRPSKYDQYVKQCQTKNVKFVDPQFPPVERSLNVDLGRRIVWRRVTEILKDPRMVQGKIQPSDIQQGNIGDCYFLAAVSAMAETPLNIERIFQNNMSLNENGIYKLIIDHKGEPRQIVIDDYVPVYENSNRPVFCKPLNNQVWVILLEKAWAKISGSYGAISAGYPHQVLNTFLVAPCFYYELRASSMTHQEKDKIWSVMIEAEQNNWPCCAGSKQSHVCKGIKPGHTYTLIGSYNVRTSDRDARIVKLRNPWGDTQFTGDFSQYDNNFWSKVGSSLKSKILNKKSEDDGIFTISFEEFLRNYESIDISHPRQGFNYQYIPTKLQRGKGQYFSLKVNSQCQGYITLEKAFDRMLFVKQRLMDYGYSKILLAKDHGNGEYEYIDSKLQTNFPDLSLRCRKLSQGRYIVYVQSGFHTDAQSEDANISVFTNAFISIQKMKKPDPIFLQKVFHSHGLIYNQQRTRIGASSDDWVITKLMFEEGGFGYIMVCLSPSCTRRVNISYDLKAVYESGYRIEEHHSRKNVNIVDPGTSFVLVFSNDLLRNLDQRQLVFPPAGVKISKII